MSEDLLSQQNEGPYFAKMNESADDYYSHEFDYQSDFTQFLKEAKNSTFQVNLNGVEKKETKQLDWEKKHRKSWKKSLFSWLKNGTRSKSKTLNQPSHSHTTCPPSRAKRANMSGPIRRSTGVVSASSERTRRAASGPLAGLFGSTGSPKGAYMCLGEIKEQKIQAYGPIYMVT
ncbi:hypothetical protein SASPL_106839 [Salvia splendens]|uniref:Uncharacterized protein n=3 Tax=Salvia splendens TaxID=180675 RepID=A0A8X9A4S7_SALSN|nr:hypothetical protein SASPL_106839 [Salvia splendens]